MKLNVLRSLVASFLLLGGTAVAQDASLTVLHGVPGLPAPVDVVANGNTLFSFCYGEQRGPLSLPAGNYAVEVQLDGATILSANLALAAGDDVSAIANLDASGAPTISAFANDGTSLALPAARLAVRHTAEAPPVDVVLSQSGSTVLTIPALANGSEASADVPPGTYDVEIFVAGTTTSAFGPIPLTVEDGFRYGVFAVGQALTPSFTLLVQRDGLAAQLRSIQGLEFPGAAPSLELDGVTVFDYATQVEDAVAVQPGTYTATVKGFGGTLTLATQQVTFAAGDDRSLFPYLGLANLFELGDFANDVSAPELFGNARVTVRHTASAPTVDVLVSQSGALVATIPGLSNGDEAVAELPAGTYDVAIAPAGTTTPVFGPVPLTFDARTNTIASAIGVLGQTFTVAAEVIDLTAVPVPFELQATTFGIGCGPTVGVDKNCFRFDEDFTVTIENGTPNSPCLLIYGSNDSNPFDGATIGAPGCTVYTNVLFHQIVPFDGTGTATATFQVPTLVAATFTRAFLQGVSSSNANALGFVVSDALAVRRN